METVDIQSELLSEIGYDCFKNCEALDYIDIPERVSIIGSSAFEGCTNLRNITLPNNLQDIYYYTFCMCKNLKELKINDGVKEIWLGAFTNCFNLETICIPGTVEKIGNRVFDGCDSLKTIYYSGNKIDWKNISIGSGNSEIDNAEIIFSDENDILDNKICTLCSAEVSNDNIFYDEDDNLICQDCYEKFYANKQECYICGEYFNTDDMLYDEDDHLICQDCYNELSEIKQECYICGEYFNPDDMLYDEDDNLICQECYSKIQNNDINEEINEIECPHCDKTFEETNDVYDEYGYIRCPYCDGYVLTETEYYEEIEFATSDWAAEEVREAYQKDLIPNEMLDDVLYNTITREEFAAIAVKLYENLTGEGTYANIYNMPFTDCNTDSKYISYIAVAYELGITKGTSQSTFSPYDNISREQLTAMLYRVIKLVENDETFDFDVNNVRKFFDDSDISDYAKESVYFMAEYGIVKGIDSAHFAPLDTATKEQSILISVRCVNSLFKD